MLRNLFKPKPTQLKHYLKTEFKEALVQVEFPNVGTYRPGSRTKITKPPTQ